MSRGIALSSGWPVVTLTLVALGACSRQHAGPEVADTVTNWLSSCERNSDCKGEAVCLNALCSLPCSPAAPSICTAIHEGASCEVGQKMCDLSCEVSASCLDLGPAFSCVAGRCRGTAVVGSEASRNGDTPANGGAVPFSDSDALPGEGGTPHGEGGARLGDSAVMTNATPRVDRAEARGLASWSPSAIADRSETSVARGTRINLSDYAVELGAPRAAWQTDHWQVAWPVPTALMLGTAIGVASVFPDGRVATERRGVGSAPRMRRVYNGPGTVAQVGGEWEGPCSLAFSDLASGQSSETWLFDCSKFFVPRVVPVIDSDDWIVIWSSARAADRFAEDILVARYDPQQLGWSGGPWAIGGGPANHIESLGATTVEGGDLWAWGPSPTTFVDGVYRVAALARPEPPQEPVVTRFDFVTGWVHAIFPVAGGMRVLETLQGSRTLHLSALDANGAVQSGHDLRDLEDNPRDVAYIPEHGLFALCTDNDGLRLRLFDQQGAQVAEPQLIEASDGVVYPSGCSLAWSGSEFLAVWTRSALGNGLPPPGFDTTVGTVHAKVVALPELTR